MPTKTTTNRRRNTTKQKLKGEVSERTRQSRIRAALAQLPDKFLECRSYRYHALKEVHKFYWNDGNKKGVCRVSKCTRCETFRDDYYNAKGELVDRRYMTPDGYSLSGLGHLESAPVMREWLSRATDIAASREDAQALAPRLRLVGAR